MISRYSVLLMGILMGFCVCAQAAPSAETYQVNLNPLIDKAVRHPTQFAVAVAKHIDSETSGRWQVDSGTAAWDYAIRIPAAASMGFHANRLILPPDGTLTISGGGQSFTYQGRDLRRIDFWSRTVKGNQIAVHISVKASLRHQALIEIAAFQAGYKSLVPGMADNPHLQGDTCADI